MGVSKERRKRRAARDKRLNRIRERADEMYASSVIHIEHKVWLGEGGHWVEAWVWVPREKQNETKQASG